MTQRAFEIYEDACFRLDLGQPSVLCGGESIELTRKEFALFVYLIKSTGRVPTRQQILDDVWGYFYYDNSRTLDVHIRRLRQKLGKCGKSIETVTSIGYRFVPPKS